MSEKRFTLDSDFVKVTSQVAWDNQEEKGLTLMKLVNLLNEQQARIELLEDNCLADNWTRSNLEGIIKEQQATIRKLQDLCGESDSENAKLRIENKRLKAENEKLRFLIDINSFSERKKLERQVDEQQATINRLEEENGELRKENKDLNDMEWEKFKKKYHLE